MKHLTRYLKGYEKQLWLGPLFKLAEAILELFVPWIVADLIDNGIAKQDFSYVLSRGGMLFVLAAVGFACAMVCQYFAAVCAYGFGSRLRQAVFERVIALSRTQHRKLGADMLITRITSDVNQVQTGVNMFIRLAVRAPFLAIGSIIAAFTINAKIALIFLVTTPLILLTLWLVMKWNIPRYQSIQKGQEKIARLSGEALEGVRVVRAFSRQEQESEAFRNAGKEVTRDTIQAGWLAAVLNPVTMVLVNLAIAFILWWGAQAVDIAVLAQGDVIAMVNYMNQTLLALVVLANIIIILTKSAASARRVADLLQIEPDMTFAEKTAPSEQESDAICFSKVSFRYENGENVLENLSFSIQKGQTLGIIGGTGSGKTTLVQLMLRAYDVSEGVVSIDGVPVQKYPKAQLSKKFGVAPQGARLFKGTIRSNLQMAAPHADDTTLKRALKAAQCFEFLQEDSALEQPVEQEGRNFSGGQRQRLTVARALARQPEILVLDDSSSALDYRTEAALRQTLRREYPCTKVIISQRVASIRDADVILVLDDGCQAGFGTHASLLETCDVYRQICQSQGEGKEDASCGS